jgi:hypothetical protein
VNGPLGGRQRIARNDPNLTNAGDSNQGDGAVIDHHGNLAEHGQGDSRGTSHSRAVSRDGQGGGAGVGGGGAMSMRRDSQGGTADMSGSRVIDGYAGAGGAGTHRGTRSGRG